MFEQVREGAARLVRFREFVFQRKLFPFQACHARLVGFDQRVRVGVQRSVQKLRDLTVNLVDLAFEGVLVMRALGRELRPGVFKHRPTDLDQLFRWDQRLQKYGKVTLQLVARDGLAIA